MDFSQIVKQLRQERGWSQQEVADRVGLNKMTISQYENGKRKPSFEMIEALAEVFHVDLNYLLGFTDKIEKPAGDETDPAANKYLAVTLAEIDLIEAFRHAGPETQAAIRAILHLEGRSSRNGIRTPGKPFVYGKYYILIVPFSHTA